MRVMEIPIADGSLRTVPKGLEKKLVRLEIRGKMEPIQTTALLRSARRLKIILETRGDLLSLKQQ